MSSIRRFVLRWYGSAGDSASGSSRVGAAAGLPRALVEWHAVASSEGVNITFQDHPIPLSKLRREIGGMLPFWIENQHSVYWAVNTESSTDEVFFRTSGTSSWRSAAESIEEFLLHCTVREAIIGAPWKFTTFVAESDLREAMDEFMSLRFPALASEESATKLFCTNNVLARLTLAPVGYGQPGEEVRMLTIAAPQRSLLEIFADRFDVEIPEDVSSRANTSKVDPPF